MRCGRFAARSCRRRGQGRCRIDGRQDSGLYHRHGTQVLRNLVSRSSIPDRSRIPTLDKATAVLEALALPWVVRFQFLILRDLLSLTARWLSVIIYLFQLFEIDAELHLRRRNGALFFTDWHVTAGYFPLGSLIFRCADLG